MKKHLLILSVAALAFTFSRASAQIINAAADDFETWSADPLNASAMDPNSGSGPGWQCFNLLSSSFTGSSPVTVFEENSIVHSGAHSAKIVTAKMTTTSYNLYKAFFPHDTIGIILTGTISGSSLKPGVPFNRHITSITFWYQYTPNGVDTASCTVVLSHFSGGKHNILGVGMSAPISTTVATWTQSTVNIFWDSGATAKPDTILVIFSASSLATGGKAKPGSILFVDGVSPVGINEINASPVNVSVYPNPASTEVNFSISGQAAARADMYDITGQKVNSYPVRNNFLAVNTQGYAQGLYFYQLYDKSGVLLRVGKFSVAR